MIYAYKLIRRRKAYYKYTYSYYLEGEIVDDIENAIILYNKLI